jgi:hypothetical protein
LWTNRGGQLLVVSLFALATVASSIAARPLRVTEKPLGDHYLLLVNTAIASMMTPDKIAQFDKSAYDGLAVAFLHAYDTSPVPSAADMDRQIAGWQKVTRKDIWPWVYINRMLAIDPADKDPYSKDPYFRRFAGADLDDKAGAQQDFLENWSNAVRAARDTHAPGIVCDLEFYNYQKAYEIPELAVRIEKSPEQTIQLLRQVGKRMADAMAAQYPDATLWFLFTGLTHPDYKVVGKQSYYPSPGISGKNRRPAGAHGRGAAAVRTNSRTRWNHDPLERFVGKKGLGNAVSVRVGVGSHRRGSGAVLGASVELLSL